MTRVLFFGGNGHSAARLDAAQNALGAHDSPPFELVSVPYPGFENRPRAADFEAFLDATASAATALRAPRTVLYATGIGGLLILCLRARGALRDLPTVLHAPVLWGLEHRFMPRLMRLGLAQLALRRAFKSPAFQRRFARKHFLRPASPETLRAFFDGYAACQALPDFFAWLTPSLLRSLEAHHTRDPSLMDDIRFIWGAKDTVVPPRELTWTETALRRKLVITTFPEWGHYPMIDDPESWVREVSRVASAPSL